MKGRILRALLFKEVLLMRRNPIIPKIILIMPLTVMLIIPLVANMDVKEVQVSVVDNDNSQLSRRTVADMDAVENIHVVGVCDNHDIAMDKIEDGKADVVLTIPRDWEKKGLKAYVEANGVNAMKSMLGARYVVASVGSTLAAEARSRGASRAMSSVSVIDLYNPTLDFRNFMIPALIVMLLIVICGFLPTLNIVSEKESGTNEAINVTPVGKMTYILSKLIPYWVVGMLVVAVGMTVGWLVYGLAPVGNIGAIFLAAILFSLIMSGLGVAIANGSSTMMQSIFVMFAIIVIFQLMGGLFTPIGSMPQWAQYFTIIVPPRYFNEIMRAVYLKGATVGDLWLQYLALFIFAANFCILAAVTYRKRS